VTMASGGRVVIDGRIIFRAQCRGIGRALIGWVEEFPCKASDGRVKMLVQRGAVSPFDLSKVAERVELVETDLPVVALYRIVAFRRLLDQLDAGVFFSPYHPFTPLAASCPVVSVVHDCIFEENAAFAGGRLRQFAYGSLSRVSLARASAVTVPSLATADAVRRYYPGVSSTEVVSNGVSIRTLGTDGNASVDEARQYFGLPRRYVLHVGARRPHKNQQLLIDVLARLDPSISLVLVGDQDPRMQDHVGERIRQLGVSNRVLELHQVPDRFMEALYTGAEAFLFPSFAEGYGIPPLEAMAARTPVVASAIPVLVEVCRDGAMYASPFDPDAWVEAVERVLSSPEVARDLTERGMAVATEATWERGGVLLYETLISWANLGGRRN
jgi:glycosyltransferase involved in cell wall biosynthesis